MSRPLQDAAEDFRLATNKDDLWGRLNRHLSHFAIAGNLYGTETFPGPDREHALILNSFAPAWLDAKFESGLFYCDEYVRAGRCETAPILWSDSSRLESEHFTPAAKASLEVDFDYGVTTGVTIPMRFAGGLGASSIGCHAAGLSWPEFDRIWGEHGPSIIAIGNAFDTALRGNHMGEVFPLNAQERECLLWLAAGLQRKQIADRLRLTDKQVEKRLVQARRKLKAVTTIQAVANALIFGVIDP